MSTLLSEEDLNDFIAPALECTKPTTFTHEATGYDENGEIIVQQELETLEKVNITLSDCLACSGCITSSEEIMLQRQSYTIFLNHMKDNPGVPLAVSISPQCRVSLATYYNIPQQQFDLCFIKFCHEYFHAKYVVGLQIGRNVSIQNTVKHLIETNQSNENNVNDSLKKKSPRLSGIDPGFVIYIEKTKPELVPHLVNVKSPHQITGHLLKNINPEVYHLSILACFDKKLEASRLDCANEIDCVITPKELINLFDELKIDFMQYKNDDISFYDKLSPLNWDAKLNWSNNLGSTTGGWAYQYIVAMERINQAKGINCQILTLPGKNINILEYRLVHADNNKTLASSSELSGFRNIQNMVRQLTKPTNAVNKRRIQVLRKRTSDKEQGNDKSDNKSKTDNLVAQPYNTDYIEVSAAPHGCINGSGLLNMETGKTQRKMYIETLTTKYRALPMIDPLGQDISNLTLDCLDKLQYKFQQLEKSNDIVNVGNRW